MKGARPRPLAERFPERFPAARGAVPVEHSAAGSHPPDPSPALPEKPASNSVLNYAGRGYASFDECYAMLCAVNLWLLCRESVVGPLSHLLAAIRPVQSAGFGCSVATLSLCFDVPPTLS